MGIKKRSEIAKEDKWNIESLYPDLAAWEADFAKYGRLDKRPHWPEISQFKGKLGEKVENVFEVIKHAVEFSTKLEKLFTWAHMRYDEDLTNEEFKAANHRMHMLYYEFVEEISWIEPELLSLPESYIKELLNSDRLKEYRFYVERIVVMKPHTLSKEQEELLAKAGQPLSTPANAFSAFNNADIEFPSPKDSEGKEHVLSHAKYSPLMRSKDRTLRKNAFETLHNTFAKHENMISELLRGHTQNHFFHAKARHFPTCLDAALFPNQIDVTVYHNLIKTVRDHVQVLHKYMKLRKEILNLKALEPFDLHVPLVSDVEFKYSFDDAVNMCIDSVAPLGNEYQTILRKGLTEQRWVDRYENKGKRSGAYSTGSYETMPYILMNFQGTFQDMMTLAHEAGHSMHSYYSRENQPPQYADYPIFLAEVASTFNEELIFAHLMKQDLTKDQKAYIINQKIEDIRNTFFRQTMFAEFELGIHALTEKNHPLTPGLMRELYHDLNRHYFGPELEIGTTIDIEWARIPHFYSNFYVYQYATGISAAHALFERVSKGGDKEREDYLGFISAGSSKYPLDILEQAGVNMRLEQPIQSLISQFDWLVDQLATLVK